jgi:hypothetical protein
MSLAYLLKHCNNGRLYDLPKYYPNMVGKGLEWDNDGKAFSFTPSPFNEVEENILNKDKLSSITLKTLGKIEDKIKKSLDNTEAELSRKNILKNIEEVKKQKEEKKTPPGSSRDHYPEEETEEETEEEETGYVTDTPVQVGSSRDHYPEEKNEDEITTLEDAIRHKMRKTKTYNPLLNLEITKAIKTEGFNKETQKNYSFWEIVTDYDFTWESLDGIDLKKKLRLDEYKNLNIDRKNFKERIIPISRKVYFQEVYPKVKEQRENKKKSKEKQRNLYQLVFPKNEFDLIIENIKNSLDTLVLTTDNEEIEKKVEQKINDPILKNIFVLDNTIRYPFVWDEKKKVIKYNPEKIKQTDINSLDEEIQTIFTEDFLKTKFSDGYYKQIQSSIKQLPEELQSTTTNILEYIYKYKKIIDEKYTQPQIVQKILTEKKLFEQDNSIKTPFEWDDVNKKMKYNKDKIMKSTKQEILNSLNMITQLAISEKEEEFKKEIPAVFGEEEQSQIGELYSLNTWKDWSDDDSQTTIKDIEKNLLEDINYNKTDYINNFYSLWSGKRTDEDYINIWMKYGVNDEREIERFYKDNPREERETYEDYKLRIVGIIRNKYGKDAISKGDFLESIYPEFTNEVLKNTKNITDDYFTEDFKNTDFPMEYFPVDYIKLKNDNIVGFIETKAFDKTVDKKVDYKNKKYKSIKIDYNKIFLTSDYDTGEKKYNFRFSFDENNKIDNIKYKKKEEVVYKNVFNNEKKENNLSYEINWTTPQGNLRFDVNYSNNGKSVKNIVGEFDEENKTYLYVPWSKIRYNTLKEKIDKNNKPKGKGIYKSIKGMGYADDILKKLEEEIKAGTYIPYEEERRDPNNDKSIVDRIVGQLYKREYQSPGISLNSLLDSKTDEKDKKRIITKVWNRLSDNQRNQFSNKLKKIFKKYVDDMPNNNDKEPLKKVGNVQIPMSLKTTSTPKKKKITTDFKEGEKVYEIEGVMTNTDKTKPVLHSELTNYNKKNDPKVNRAIKKSLLGFTKEDLLKKNKKIV